MFSYVKSSKQDYVLKSIGNQHPSTAFSDKKSHQWLHKNIVEVDIDASIWRDLNTNSEPNRPSWTAIGTSARTRARPRSTQNVTKLVTVALAVRSE